MQITPLTDQEIQQLRTDTIGTAKKIHFNNAGASLPPDVVVNTVVNYLHEEAIEGGYETEYKYREELDKVYTSIAKLINAEKDEVAVIENASIAWGLAFNGIRFSAGDEIITSEMEYVTNLIGFLDAKQKHGIEIKLIPNDNDGNFDMAKFESAISSKTKLIAITHIPSTAGGMMPVEAIGQIARRHNILYLVDACQSAGQIPLDVKAMGCDMLSVTGRKYLRGPRGTGFLFVKREVQDQLQVMFMDGFTADLVSETEFKIRNDARRFEVYEKNRALTLGLGKAIDYALAIGVDRIWQRVQYLANLLRDKLSAVNGITVHDIGSQKCGIVTFSVDGINSGIIKEMLFEKNINVSVAMAKNTLVYMNKHHLNGILRASVHYYNTEEEIDVLCTELKALAG